MVQTHLAEIAKLKQQTSRSIEIGDLSTAYCSSKQILNMLENSSLDNHIPDSSEMANVLYEVGLICIALDKYSEGTRHLQRAIEFCHDKNESDSWILREAGRALRDIEPCNIINGQSAAKSRVQIT